MLRPKPFLENIKLRNRAIGTERRRNMSKLIMLHAPNFPLEITYEDVDQEFIRWVEQSLGISYDGKRLPTVRLFSNQRLSEYEQSWNQLDDAGNLMMNFKTVTRENNPQRGEQQGGSYNIPGDRYYPMYYVPTLQENGTEAYDVYEMKQPYPVNFVYTIGIITNKLGLVNDFNRLVLERFKAYECYISPNGHAMPMFLDSVTDESEYGIDNRKYYSQSFKIKLEAYIIRKEDFRVTRLPSRVSVKVAPTGASKKPSFKLDSMPKSNPSIRATKLDGDMCETEYGYEFLDIKDNTPDEHSQIMEPPTFRPIIINGQTVEAYTCGTRDDDYFDGFAEDENVPVDVSVDDDCCNGPQRPFSMDDGEEQHLHNRAMSVVVEFPACRNKTTFDMDSDMDLTGITTDNVFDFLLKINGERVQFNDTIHIKSGDEITIKLSRNEVGEVSEISLYGTNPNEVYDDRFNPESQLDDIPDTEVIHVEA